MKRVKPRITPELMRGRLGFALELYYWGARRRAWQTLLWIAEDLKDYEDGKVEDGQER